MPLGPAVGWARRVSSGKTSLVGPLLTAAPALLRAGAVTARVHARGGLAGVTPLTAFLIPVKGKPLVEISLEPV